MILVQKSTEAFSGTIYRIGDRVPESGVYACVPCGFVQEFREGDLFVECLMCLAGTDRGPDGFSEQEIEFWQRSS